MVQPVHSYFHHHPTTSLGREVAYLGTHYYNIQNILKILIPMFPYKISRLYKLQPRYYTKPVEFSKSFVDICLPNSGFLVWIALFDRRVVHFLEF